ncbi:hypothetical protein Glove_74g199 [Diversispora epigaea]|uniref:Uncharacterized protein n=1 Tax=Diversispora epigaea TaxID=1348612 RepID=A0A397JA43_9GLOM|nr:hypothetical protein Glove_74g199 [Diversispora epigaea]
MGGEAQNQNLQVNLDEWTNDETTLKQCLSYIRYFSISSEDVFEMIFPYQQILEPKLWSDINKRIMAPNKPISSTVLPPRKILNKFHRELIGDGLNIPKTIFMNLNYLLEEAEMGKNTGEILGGYIPCKLENKNKGWIFSQDSFTFSLKTANLENSILSRVKTS